MLHASKARAAGKNRGIANLKHKQRNQGECYETIQSSGESVCVKHIRSHRRGPNTLGQDRVSERSILRYQSLSRTQAHAGGDVMMAWIKGFFNPKSLEEQYLSGAHDLYDLEQRQKRVQRGQAPFQLVDHSYRGIMG